MISTPNGTAGKFYELAKQAGLVGSEAVAPVSSPAAAGGDTRATGLWSGHKVDIYEAVKDGLPADIKLLRAGCDDEETWLQEYCCQFLSDAQNYIPVGADQHLRFPSLRLPSTPILLRCAKRITSSTWASISAANAI